MNYQHGPQQLAQEAVFSIRRSSRGSGGNSDCFDLSICPDLLLATIAGFSAVAFFLLYQAITVRGRRRKRRRKRRDDDRLQSHLERATLRYFGV